MLNSGCSVITAFYLWLTSGLWSVKTSKAETWLTWLIMSIRLSILWMQRAMQILKFPTNKLIYSYVHDLHTLQICHCGEQVRCHKA